MIANWKPPYLGEPHGAPTRTCKPLPDFAQLHEELQRHPHLTLQLAWEEYRQAHPDGYAYSRFCELYQQWRQRLDVVLRQDHVAGEKLFVDYAGATIPIHDPQGGPERQAAIFVAVLGASNYTYAEATASQELEHWLGSHIRTFEFLGGVPKLVIPDNTRSGVNRACRYEPDLNRTYHELAMHYGVGVLPTRPYKPRDKAKVETGVQIVQRWIVAALRHRKFFSLAELNQAIRELLAKLNQRPFRKRPGCRASLFQELDRPTLGPLPCERFELQQWATARVNIDYHVEIDRDSAWVREHQNIFLLGPTGIGKSFLACALAEKACRDGFTAWYTRAAQLFRDLALARADGSLRTLLARLARLEVLVVDAWAMAPLADAERRDFLEICEDRYQRRSTILTSQLPVAKWHEQIGDPTLADSILDRLVHNAHRIEMRGESLRKKRGDKE